MGTEIATVTKADPIDQLVRSSEMLAPGIRKMMGVDSNEEANLVLYTCLHENITPLDFARKYHIVKGRPSMRADAMLAEFRMRGGKHVVIKNSSTEAAVELIDPDGNKHLFELTWEEIKQSRWPWTDKARTALKDNWSTDTDRRNMLWARLVSNAVRVFCPEICAGAYTPEEMEDSIGTVIADSGDKPSVLDEMNARLNQVEDPESEPAKGAETDGDVVEADFEIKEEVKEDAKKEPEPAEEEPQKSEEVDPDATLPGLCTKSQRAELQSLIEKCKEIGKITDAVVANALSDRGVTQPNQLTKEQISEMITKLKGMAGK